MKAAERLAFQTHILESMRGLRQRPLLRGVVLELDFFTAQANPPEPQSLAKNYVDLLFRPETSLKTRRKALWFLDDRQVEVLSIA